MAYKNNIPASNDLLSQSQADIQTNFASIQTLIQINHEAFDTANQGKHKQVALPVQAADPLTAASEVAVYCKDNSAGVASLFFKPENTAVGGTEYDFTTSLPAATGWTRVPSGILFKWGSGTVNGPYPAAFALPVAATVPIYTTIFNVILTPNGDGGAGLYDYMPYITGFSAAPDVINIYGSARTVNVTRNNINFRYLVIGI